MQHTIDTLADEALREAADGIAQPPRVRLTLPPAPVVRVTGIPRGCKIAWSMVPVAFVALLWLTFLPSWSQLGLSLAGLLLTMAVVYAPFESVAGLIGVRRSGARPMLAVLGPWVGGRVNDRMRWRWDWRARHYTSLVVPDSVAGRSDLTRYVSELRWAFFGVILRALVALAFVVLAWRVRTVASLPLLCGIVLLLLCVSHVLRMAAVVSRRQRSMRTEDGRERWLAVRALTLASLHGARPRAWDPAIVARLRPETADPTVQTAAYLLVYTAALDAGDGEAAEWMLDAASSSAGQRFSTLQSSVAREAAYLAARKHHDPATARQWLRRARIPALQRGVEQRVEAAVLLAEGQPEAALATARAGMDDARSWIVAGDALYELDLLRAIETDCLRAMGVTQSHADTA